MNLSAKYKSIHMIYEHEQGMVKKETECIQKQDTFTYNRKNSSYIFKLSVVRDASKEIFYTILENCQQSLPIASRTLAT